jgi:hypothetical protein
MRPRTQARTLAPIESRSGTDHPPPELLEGVHWCEPKISVHSSPVARTLLLLVVLLAVARSSPATVYAPMDDATLTGASAAIVTGTVTETTARKIGHRIVTETTVAVDRVYKGEVGMTVTLTTPGGTVGDETSVVFGAPRFVDGDAVLLYLQQGPHGEVRTTALALGAYRLETTADGSVVATHAVPLLETRPLDDVEATTQALGDPGSALESGAGGPTTAPFTFLGSPPGRWFQADQGTPIRLSVANSDAGLGPSVSNAVVDDGLGAWTNVPTASIDLRRGPSTSAAPSVAGGTCDGESVVMFNDPFGEIPPLSNGCFGVLAIGGFCTKGSPTTFDGQQFAHISEGDLTVADGLGSCMDREGFDEVVTHEIGHAIGMGHSSENPNEPNPVLKDATMYFLLHLDGRGAGLRDDDIEGISALYPGGADPNDLDGDGVANGADACPSTPAGTAVDASGCGCDEAGHVACDDGLVCTQDLCDSGSGHCIAPPRDCTGGDPCLTGSCDETTGCTTAAVTGDAAVLCVYDRIYPPVACSGERVPRSVRHRLTRAATLTRHGLERGNPKLLAAADRQLARARKIIDRAAQRRRRPQGAVCAAALGAFVDDARSRLPL